MHGKSQILTGAQADFADAQPHAPGSEPSACSQLLRESWRLSCNAISGWSSLRVQLFSADAWPRV